MSRTPRRMFYCLAIGTGLVLAVAVGPYLWIQGREQASWPTIEGRVLRTDVEQRGPSSRNKRRYVPTVEYAYFVAGREWTSSTFSSTGDERFRSLDDARAFLAHYPIGARLTVHYDEQDPSRAVLQPTPADFAWVVAGLGLVFAAAGGVGLWRTQS